MGCSLSLSLLPPSATTLHMERPLKRAYEQYQGMKYQRREIIYLCKLTSKNIDGGQKAITRKLFSTLKNCLDTIEE